MKEETKRLIKCWAIICILSFIMGCAVGIILHRNNPKPMQTGVINLMSELPIEPITTPVSTEKQVMDLILYDEIELPYLNNTNLSAKAYMDYKMITDKTSPQYDLIHNSGKIQINSNGFLTDEDGYIGVAMGSYFGEIGTRYRITLENGKIVKVIKVERKADTDTDCYNIRDTAGGIIELVINTNSEYMQSRIADNGYIFQGNFNNCESFAGNITKIERVLNE